MKDEGWMFHQLHNFIKDKDSSSAADPNHPQTHPPNKPLSYRFQKFIHEA